jgi:hypothetical protein
LIRIQLISQATGVWMQLQAAAYSAGDPVVAASAIVGEPDSVRQGWVDTATLAAELGKLAPLVCAAAELCGLAIFDDT